MKLMQTLRITLAIKTVIKKNKLKGVGNIEIDDEYLDEVLHNNVNR